MNKLFRFLILLLPLLSLACPAYSDNPAREDVLERYAQVIRMVERLHLAEDDVLEVIPRLKKVTHAIFQEDVELAEGLLSTIESDLDIIIEQAPTSVKKIAKYLWLELFFDVFQKFAFLIIFAYFFAKWRFFNLKLHRRRFDMMACVYVALLLGTLSIVMSLVDVSRYGESAWGFFDIQIVLVTLCGLIGGLGAGLLAGTWVGLFRWVLSPEAYVYMGLITVVGILSGFAAKKMRDFKKPGKVGFYTGALVGLLHALIIYVPLVKLIPWHYFIGTIAMLAVLEGAAVGVFFRVVANVLNEQNRRSLESDLLRTKLLFLQAQMNPHFLFNALNTISAICMKEKALNAQKLIVKLAELLRRTLRRVDEEVTLRDEISYIDSYLEIEKARFCDRIKIEKKVDLSADDWNVKLPILILQPLVENAIHHGIGQKVEGGTIKIDLSRQKNHVCIEISDDGIGIDPSIVKRIQKGDKTVSTNGNGIGVHNINERLMRVFGKEYALEFHSSKEKGTRICVRIPKKR